MLYGSLFVWLFKNKYYTMKKMLSIIILSIALSSCDVLSKLPTGTFGGVTEAEAGQGVA